MRQRLLALGVGLLFLGAVVGVAVVSRDGEASLRKLPFGAAGAERMSAAADSAMAASVTYELADGVKDPADEASAYELSSPERSHAERVARALDIDGDADRRDGAWVVSDDERMVRVEPSGAWHLADTSCGNDASVSSDGEVFCAKPLAGAAGVSSSGPAEPEDRRRAEESSVATAEPSTGGGSDPSGGSGSTGSAPDAPPPPVVCDMPDCPEGSACIQACPEPRPEPTPVRPSDLPSEQEARSIAERVLSAMGFDPDEGRMEVTDGFTNLSVTFDPEIDGRPVLGMTQFLAIGSKGSIDYANGWVVDPDELGSYPLAGIDEGVERLNDPTFLGGGGIGRAGVPAVGAPEPAIADCAADGPGCTEVPGDEPLAPEDLTVTLTGVEMALQLVPWYQAAEPSYLVPSYLFTTEDGGQVPVVAVTDELLVETTPDQPEPDPNATPTDPGGREPASQSCGGTAGGTSASGAGSDDAPVVLSVCVSDAEVKVGEVVVFDVTAYDEDALIYHGDCRKAPVALFGDEEGGISSCIADCEAPGPGTTWDRQADKWGERFEHAYRAPGTYTAVFSAQSGDACGQNPYGSSGEMKVTITVTE